MTSAELDDLRAAFVAVGVGGRTRGAPVEEMLQRLRRADDGLRWLEPEDLHVTLAYLGDVERTRAAAVIAALRSIAGAVGCPPLEVRGLGCFPDERRPRVLWAGVSSDSEGFIELKQAVERALEPLGFEPERRPFRPHVTMARASNGPARRALAELLRTHREDHVCRFDVPDLSLFARDPTRRSRYAEIARLPLGPAPVSDGRWR